MSNRGRSRVIGSECEAEMPVVSLQEFPQIPCAPFDIFPDIEGIFQAETGDRLLVQVVGKRRAITQLPTGGLTEEQMPKPTDLVVISLT